MSCESNSSCSTQQKSCHSQEESSSCSSKQSCCPIEKAIEMWQKSFCEAMRGVMVEILKEKIRSKWGAKMQKEGDAVINAMEAQWQAMLAQGKAGHQFKEEMRNIILS